MIYIYVSLSIHICTQFPATSIYAAWLQVLHSILKSYEYLLTVVYVDEKPTLAKLTSHTPES